MTIPAFIHNISVRVKVVAQYYAILGSEDAIEEYTKVLYRMKGENGTENSSTSEVEGSELHIDSDNLGLRLEILTIDIIVINLGIKSAVLEDAPCIIINSLVLLGILGSDLDEVDGVSPKKVFAIVSLLFSAIVLGRKIGLPSQRNHLLWERWDLENELHKLSKTEQDHARLGSIRIVQERQSILKSVSVHFKMAELLENPDSKIKKLATRKLKNKKKGEGSGGGGGSSSKIIPLPEPKVEAGEPLNSSLVDNQSLIKSEISSIKSPPRLSAEAIGSTKFNLRKNDSSRSRSESNGLKKTGGSAGHHYKF